MTLPLDFPPLLAEAERLAREHRDTTVAAIKAHHHNSCDEVWALVSGELLGQADALVDTLLGDEKGR